MKQRVLRMFIGALIALGAITATAQQSTPGFTYGMVPSAAQWNSYFAGKLDYNAGGLAVLYGGTGATNGPDALLNLAGAATSGLYLRGNGSRVVLGAIQPADVPGLAGGAVGSIPYQSAASTTGYLTGNTTTTPQFLTSTGTGSAALAPTYTASIGTGSVILAAGDTGTGSVVRATSPSFSGATITTSTINGNTITAGSGTLTLGTKSLTMSNTMTFQGFDNNIISFPNGNPAVATTNNGNTFGGTQTFSGTVTGSALTTYFASPPAIGGTVAAAGSFTTLSASSTVSGTGFSSYLASPPAIGGTAASTIKGTTVNATTGFQLNSNLMSSTTAPTVSACGTSPSVSAPSGTAAFRVTVGTGGAASACTLTMPAAANGWNCVAQNMSTTGNDWQIRLTTGTTTSVQFGNRSAGVATPFGAGDVLAVTCAAF